MAGVPVRAVDGYLMRLVRQRPQGRDLRADGGPAPGQGHRRARDRARGHGRHADRGRRARRARAQLPGLRLRLRRRGRAGLGRPLDRALRRLRVAGRALARRGRAHRSRRSSSGPRACPRRAPSSRRSCARSSARAISEREAWRFDRETRAARAEAALQGRDASRASASTDDAPVVAGRRRADRVPRGDAARRLRARAPIELRRERRGTCVLDRATRSCLELVRTQRDGRREGTLLDGHRRDAARRWAGGCCASGCSRRCARSRRSATASSGVAELVDAPFLREELRELLADVLDVERLAAKISTGRANARDLVGLAPLAGAGRRRCARSSSTSTPRRWASCSARSTRSRTSPAASRATLVDAPPLAIARGRPDPRRASPPSSTSCARSPATASRWMARFQAEEIARTGIPA